MPVTESIQYLSNVVGRRRALQIARAEAVQRIAAFVGGPAWGAMVAPSLGDIVAVAPSVTSHEEVLEWLGVDAGSYIDEFAEVKAAIDARYLATSLTCPPEWAIESSTSRVLYCLVRHLRPANVIETGIANGHSSFVILSALTRNEHGTLSSIDVREDTGGLVPESMRVRWERIIVSDRRPSAEYIADRLQSTTPFDIFFHDGDHRFLGQLIDYQVAANGLTLDGVIMSDDINTSKAWISAAESNVLPPERITLIDRRKAVGFARRSRSAN